MGGTTLAATALDCARRMVKGEGGRRGMAACPRGHGGGFGGVIGEKMMSDLEASVKLLADRVQQYGDTMTTEEAAKTSVILPFLQALGFDVFNPSEVIPEYTADAVGKKGEKVDYAVCIDGEIKILIECKGLTTQLETKELSQLFRYFTVTNAKFGILTNSRNFRFYSDIDEPNKLDKKPFFTFDILNYSQFDLAELKKFQKAAFDVNGILANAERLKYISAVKVYLSSQMEGPSDTFVRAVASEVHDGRITAKIRTTIAGAIKTAFKEVIRDSVQTRLSTALQSSSESEGDRASEQEERAEIVTTEEEIEGMMIIRAIVRDTIDGRRVGMRDAKSYCAILIDDNNRKPLARLHFNSQNKSLGIFFDGKKEERVPISELGDIYNHSEHLRATAKKYTQET